MHGVIEQLHAVPRFCETAGPEINALSAMSGKFSDNPTPTFLHGVIENLPMSGQIQPLRS
ncbi:MAG: hypothetical protein MAG794_00671 [Gammaproteobacteria bacterium]|nr:hypothetical protein [Gammaproteobacteria bacterium]